jgi:hypothetical protein
MDRLRAILILRGLFAAFFAVLGTVLLANGDAFFGAFAIVVGVTNAVLIGVVIRRARHTG